MTLTLLKLHGEEKHTKEEEEGINRKNVQKKKE